MRGPRCSHCARHGHSRREGRGGLALPGQNLPETLQCFGVAGWELWVPVELTQHFGKGLLLLPACPGVGVPAVADSIRFPPTQYPAFLRIYVALLEQVDSPTDQGAEAPTEFPPTAGCSPRDAADLASRGFRVLGGAW